MHRGKGLDLMGFQVVEALREGTAGIEIAPGRRPEHDAQGVFCRGREFERIIVQRLDRGLVRAPRQSLGLLARLKQLPGAFGHQPDQLADLPGQLGGIAGRQRVLRQAGTARHQPHELAHPGHRDHGGIAQVSDDAGGFGARGGRGCADRRRHRGIARRVMGCGRRGPRAVRLPGHPDRTTRGRHREALRVRGLVASGCPAPKSCHQPGQTGGGDASNWAACRRKAAHRPPIAENQA